MVVFGETIGVWCEEGKDRKRKVIGVKLKYKSSVSNSEDFFDAAYKFVDTNGERTVSIFLIAIRGEIERFF